MDIVYKPKNCMVCDIVFTPYSSMSKYCDSCRASVARARTKEYRDSHKEKIAEKRKEYYIAHREHAAITHKKWVAANLERRKAQIKCWKDTHKKEIAEYELAHREERLVKSKLYHEANKEHEKAYREQYRIKNRETINARVKRWRDSDKEHGRINLRAWREAHPEHAKLLIHNYRARKRGNGGKYTLEEIRAQWDMQNGICPYCGELIYSTLDKERHIEHVIPVSRGGPNSIDNIVLACNRCNLEKQDKTAEEYLAALNEK